MEFRQFKVLSENNAVISPKDLYTRAHTRLYEKKGRGVYFAGYNPLTSRESGFSRSAQT